MRFLSLTSLTWQTVPSEDKNYRRKRSSRVCSHNIGRRSDSVNRSRQFPNHSIMKPGTSNESTVNPGYTEYDPKNIDAEFIDLNTVTNNGKHLIGQVSSCVKKKIIIITMYTL